MSSFVICSIGRGRFDGVARDIAERMGDDFSILQVLVKTRQEVLAVMTPHFAVG